MTFDVNLAPVTYYGPRDILAWDGATLCMAQSVTNNARLYGVAVPEIGPPIFAAGFGYTDTSTSDNPYNGRVNFVRLGLVPAFMYYDSDSTYRVATMHIAADGTLTEVASTPFPSQTPSATPWFRSILSFPDNPDLIFYGNHWTGSAYTVEAFSATMNADGTLTTPVSLGAVTHTGGSFPGGGSDYLGNLHTPMAFSDRLAFDVATRAIYDRTNPTTLIDGYGLIPDSLGCNVTYDQYFASARAKPGHMFAIRRPLVASANYHVADLSVSADGSTWSVVHTWVPPDGTTTVIAGLTGKGKVVAYVADASSNVRAFYDIFGAPEEFTPADGVLVNGYFYVAPVLPQMSESPSLEQDAWLTGDGSSFNGSMYVVSRTVALHNNAHHGTDVAKVTVQPASDSVADEVFVALEGLGVPFEHVIYEQDFADGSDLESAGWTWNPNGQDPSVYVHDYESGLTSAPETTALRMRQLAAATLYNAPSLVSPDLFTAEGLFSFRFWANLVNPNQHLGSGVQIYLSNATTGNWGINLYAPAPVAHAGSDPSLATPPGWQQHTKDVLLADSGQYVLNISDSTLNEAGEFVGPMSFEITKFQAYQQRVSPWFPLPSDRVEVSYQVQLASESVLWAQPMVDWGVADGTQPDNTRLLQSDRVGDPYQIGGSALWSQVDITTPVVDVLSSYDPSALVTQIDPQYLVNDGAVVIAGVVQGGGASLWSEDPTSTDADATSTTTVVTTADKNTIGWITPLVGDPTDYVGIVLEAMIAGSATEAVDEVIFGLGIGFANPGGGTSMPFNDYLTNFSLPNDPTLTPAFFSFPLPANNDLTPDMAEVLRRLTQTDTVDGAVSGKRAIQFNFFHGSAEVPAGETHTLKVDSARLRLVPKEVQPPHNPGIQLWRPRVVLTKEDPRIVSGPRSVVPVPSYPTTANVGTGTTGTGTVLGDEDDATYAETVTAGSHDSILLTFPAIGEGGYTKDQAGARIRLQLDDDGTHPGDSRVQITAYDKTGDTDTYAIWGASLDDNTAIYDEGLPIGEFNPPTTGSIVYLADASGHLDGDPDSDHWWTFQNSTSPDWDTDGTSNDDPWPALTDLLAAGNLVMEVTRITGTRTWTTGSAKVFEASIGIPAASIRPDDGTTFYVDCEYVPESGKSVKDQPYLDGDQSYGVWEGTPRHATSRLLSPSEQPPHIDDGTIVVGDAVIA